MPKTDNKHRSTFVTAVNFDSKTIAHQSKVN